MRAILLFRLGWTTQREKFVLCLLKLIRIRKYSGCSQSFKLHFNSSHISSIGTKFELYLKHVRLKRFWVWKKIETRLKWLEFCVVYWVCLPVELKWMDFSLSIVLCGHTTIYTVAFALLVDNVWCAMLSMSPWHWWVRVSNNLCSHPLHSDAASLQKSGPVARDMKPKPKPEPESESVSKTETETETATETETETKKKCHTCLMVILACRTFKTLYKCYKYIQYNCYLHIFFGKRKSWA